MLHIKDDALLPQLPSGINGCTQNPTNGILPWDDLLFLPIMLLQQQAEEVKHVEAVCVCAYFFQFSSNHSLRRAVQINLSNFYFMFQCFNF